MSNKYRVEFEGHTFRRSSKNRVYTHAVVGKRSLEVDRAEAVERAKRDWKSERTFLERQAAGALPGASLLSSAALEKIKADAHESLAKFPAEEDRVRARVECNERQLANALLTADGTAIVFCLGWCGRPDLAQRLAAQHRGGNDQIVILTAIDDSKQKRSPTNGDGLTEKEQVVLNALRETHEGPDAKNEWSTVYIDNARGDCGMSPHEFAGVLGSLKLKGLYRDYDDENAGVFGDVKLAGGAA